MSTKSIVSHTPKHICEHDKRVYIIVSNDIIYLGLEVGLLNEPGQPI